MLNPALREIWRDDGAEEVIEPRVMQVLLALAKARGEIVRREDLTEHCWEGRIVEEDAINRVLSRLRRVAEGIGKNSLRIETKVGYRLVELIASHCLAWCLKKSRKMWDLALTIILTMPAEATAQQDAPPPVAAPGAGSAQGDASLTIYNDDAALVQDVHALDLAAGRVLQSFPDVSLQIRPETVSLAMPHAAIVEQNFDYDLLSPSNLIKKAVSETITLVRTNPATGAETSNFERARNDPVSRATRSTNPMLLVVTDEARSARCAAGG